MIEQADDAIGVAIDGIRIRVDRYLPAVGVSEIGHVESVMSGVATVSGLPSVGLDEILQFQAGIQGIAFNLDEGEIGVVLLGDPAQVCSGEIVTRTGRIMDVPVGGELIGRVINPVGKPLDGLQDPRCRTRMPIERTAPSIVDRSAVTVPLATGLKVIDALVPIGRGQRELILGDRQTGKTSIALGTIANQKGTGVICVYCAIGQRGSSISGALSMLRESGAMDHTVVVATEGSDSPGLNYIAPYAATSIAEYFVDKGKDVLIVYDDLTRHARTYRELSLLLRRPPGREAFPGDIFYIHSRLLERATHLRDSLGGGSLTALPILETEAQDIAAYIPTNLISITDGQIYLSPQLFELGVLPAVDVGRSVSRVGGKAQMPAYRAVAGNLKLAFSQFEELETFARFGTKLDDATRKTIEHGRRVRACFTQRDTDRLSFLEQITVLLALTDGVLDDIPLEKIDAAERELRKAAALLPSLLTDKLESGAGLDDDSKMAILEACRRALADWKAEA